MSDCDESFRDQLVDKRDYQYIARLRDTKKKQAAYCTVSRYRRPDHLAVGCPVPKLQLTKLNGNEVVDLGAVYDHPLVLVFGSYT